MDGNECCKSIMMVKARNNLLSSVHKSISITIWTLNSQNLTSRSKSYLTWFGYHRNDNYATKASVKITRRQIRRRLPLAVKNNTLIYGTDGQTMANGRLCCPQTFHSWLHQFLQSQAFSNKHYLLTYKYICIDRIMCLTTLKWDSVATFLLSLCTK